MALAFCFAFLTQVANRSILGANFFVRTLRSTPSALPFSSFILHPSAFSLLF
jgi:hypothetical protein